MSYLLAHEVVHGIIALPFALLMYAKTRSIKLGLSVVFVTYFLDMDHLIDFLLNVDLKFSLRDFLTLDYFSSGYARVFFHAWEWVILCGLVAYKRSWRSIFTVLCLGILPHLIYDSITINSLVKYSIIYRISRGFYIP